MKKVYDIYGQEMVVPNGHRISRSGLAISLSLITAGFTSREAIKDVALLTNAPPAMALGILFGLAGASLANRSNNPEKVRKRMMIAGAVVGLVSSALFRTDLVVASLEAPPVGADSTPISDIQPQMPVGEELAKIAVETAVFTLGTAVVAQKAIVHHQPESQPTSQPRSPQI